MGLKQDMRGSELIINPTKGTLYHINMARKDGFPPRFLLVGDPKRVKEVAKFFDDGIKGKKSNREYVSVWGTYRGLPVAAMGTGIGTDNTEIALVELHAVHEYDHENNVWEQPKEPLTLIRVGTSGSPQKGIALGSVGITEHAIGLDSTGLFYLHQPAEDYARHLDTVFYTPGNLAARKIWLELRKLLPGLASHVLRPYVSTPDADTLQALLDASKIIGQVPYEKGITTSAPGFFGPQGRKVGRLSNILVPDLQERLARISVKRLIAVDDAPERATNNEMESSTLLRIAAEILGYRAGAVCAVIANRAEGQFITKEDYARSVDAAIKVALEAMHVLG